MTRPSHNGARTGYDGAGPNVFALQAELEAGPSFNVLGVRIGLASRDEAQISCDIRSMGPHNLLRAVPKCGRCQDKT